MTALAQAFRAAGFETPREEMIRIATEAWAKWPAESGGGARRDYVAQKFAAYAPWCAIQEFAPHVQTQVIGALLNSVRQMIRAEAAKSSTDGGQSKPGIQMVSAPAPSKPKLAAAPAPGAKDAGCAPAGGGHELNDNQGVSAPATSSPDRSQPETDAPGGRQASITATPRSVAPAASNLKALADKHQAATRASAATLVRLSRLDTVKIGDKPIGDCTAGEVRAWAAQRQHDARAAGRDARFALILTSNLTSEKIIRHYWQDPAEVDAQYAKAEAEYAA